MRLDCSLIAVVVLTACNGDTEAPGPSTPRHPAEARVAWVVSERTAGPLRIGMSVEAAGRALGARLVPMNGGPACDIAELPGGPADLSVMVIADTLVRFDIMDSLTRTPEGVGVGSSEATVFAAYPGRVTVEPHKYDGPTGHYLIVPARSDSAFAYVFETDGELVTLWRAGRRKEVRWVEGCA